MPTATAGLFRLDSAGIWIQYNSPSVGGAGLNGTFHCSSQDTERLCAGVGHSDDPQEHDVAQSQVWEQISSSEG